MEWLTDPNAWIGLLTLTVLELVLGIDNIIFITILAGKLPQKQRNKARTIGLGFAMLMRILLLLCLSWIMGLTHPLFTVAHFAVTGRGMILTAGGLFLLVKSTHEIHDRIEGEDLHRQAPRSIHVAVGADPNHSARCRFLSRFCDYSGWNGRRNCCDDHRSNSVGDCHDGFCRTSKPLRRSSSHRQDARAQLSPPHRRQPHRP